MAKPHLTIKSYGINLRMCVYMPHIMELVGKTRVVVKDGKVVEVGDLKSNGALFLPS